jgi:NMD protein affecting ribosome stability and mRNA decay
MTEPTPCTWEEDDEGIWSSTCGQEWEFNVDTPEGNNFRFCPFCGHPLEQKRWVDPGHAPMGWCTIEENT